MVIGIPFRAPRQRSLGARDGGYQRLQVAIQRGSRGRRGVGVAEEASERCGGRLASCRLPRRSPWANWTLPVRTVREPIGERRAQKSAPRGCMPRRPARTLRINLVV